MELALVDISWGGQVPGEGILEAMAKSASETKKPGRLRQMWDVFQMTRRLDKRAIWYLLAAFLLPTVAGVVVALIISRGAILTLIMWIVAGVLTGILLALIVLGRRAERAAYSQIDGQQGAVGAVMRSALKRGWTGTEDPIAFNGKTRDALYRAVGRGGIVLISEGPASRTRRLVNDERKRIARILPNVPITVLSVGPDEDAVPLHKLARRLSKIKPVLTKAEVREVVKRLDSLPGAKPPIPKGIDPMKVRAQRPR